MTLVCIYDFVFMYFRVIFISVHMTVNVLIKVVSRMLLIFLKEFMCVCVKCYCSCVDDHQADKQYFYLDYVMLASHSSFLRYVSFNNFNAVFFVYHQCF